MRDLCVGIVLIGVTSVASGSSADRFIGPITGEPVEQGVEDISPLAVSERIGLVDHEDATPATHDFTVAMAAFQ